MFSDCRLLVIGAHPDDELLGCGGTVSRLVEEGGEAHALVLSGVTSSRRGQPADDRQKREIDREFERAAGEIGYATWRRAGFPDNRFDTMPFLDLVHTIEDAKAAHDPDLVFTHDPGDLNLDHQLVSRAVVTAFRPVPGARPMRIWAFETPSSTEWQDSAAGGFSPTTYVDIGATLAAKERALACYASELREFPHPRSLEGIRILARKRGCEAGLEHAEAFRLVRQVIGPREKI